MLISFDIATHLYILHSLGLGSSSFLSDLSTMINILRHFHRPLIVVLLLSLSHIAVAVGDPIHVKLGTVDGSDKTHARNFNNWKVPATTTSTSKRTPTRVRGSTSSSSRYTTRIDDGGPFYSTTSTPNGRQLVSKCGVMSLSGATRGGAAGVVKGSCGGSGGGGGGGSRPPITRATFVYAYLNSINYVDFDIQGSGSPEEAAAEFLINDDPLQLSPGSEALKQRYAVLTLWYHSNHPWVNETGWLSGDSECLWHGISCNEEGKVVAVDVYENGYVGSVPPDIALLTDLFYIDFDLSVLSGSSLPSSIGELSNLEVFYMSRCGLSGTIPTSLSRMTSLVTLTLHTNDLTGMLPDDIGDMTKLTYLTIFGNSQLGGTLPNSIERLTDMRIFSVYNCQFIGTIPSGISSWTEIEKVTFSDNQFDGPLPDMGQWIKAENVLFNFNSLTGTIPPSASEMESLTWFGVAGNALTGPLPDFSKWTNANVEVVFFDNFLSGPLPESLGAMTALKIFSVYNNFLTGALIL